MLFLTALLSILFGVQFVTQFNRAPSRIASTRTISAGLLSNNDIVAISHKRYTNHHYYPAFINGQLVRHCTDDYRYIDAYARTESCRFYLSSNGRLYKRIVKDGHSTVVYISRQWALTETKYTPAHHEVSYIVKPGNARSVVQAQYIRPALAVV